MEEDLELLVVEVATLLMGGCVLACHNILHELLSLFY